MSDTIHTDTLHVIHARAAGLDVHKMQITASVRLARVGGLLSDLFGVNGRRILDGLVAGRAPDDILASLSGHVRGRLTALGDALSAPLRPHVRFVLNDQLNAFENAEARSAAYAAFVEQQLAPYQSQLDLLMTLPGIDHSAACAILIELGPDVQVFPSSRHCAAWAGLCPGNNQSAGKRRHGNTRKGNPFLRTLLIECAHGAARTHHCQFQGYHKALTVRRGYKRATVATAHKLLRTLYRMLATGTPYRDPHTDYEAPMVKRNAPRWIKMLKQHGIDPATGAVTTPAA